MFNIQGLGCQRFVYLDGECLWHIWRLVYVDAYLVAAWIWPRASAGVRAKSVTYSIHTTHNATHQHCLQISIYLKGTHSMLYALLLYQNQACIPHFLLLLSLDILLICDYSFKKCNIYLKVLRSCRLLIYNATRRRLPSYLGSRIII